VIVLDASVLIAYLDGEDAHHDSAERLLVEAADDDIVVGVLTMAEVLVAPERESRLDAVLAVLRDLEVDEAPLPSDAAVALARLRASTGLKMPDCAVLLTAGSMGAELASFDSRLVRAAAGRGIAVRSVRSD
jgi:predicted nucleic acid-binding protein